MNEVKLSVLCLAYNHEKYIEKALEGFVNQKTNFQYEVLINDDCSTDGTRKIIQEYQKKYPQIIKPVFQVENQYSKHIDINKQILLPLSLGKYIAFCEGDDFWIDNNKLQIQYDYLEANIDCSICVHQGIRHECITGEETFLTDCDTERDFSVEDVILGGGGLFATNSIVMRKEVYANQRDCFNIPSFGDFQIVINGAINGKCHFIPNPMSVYNIHTEGSWSMNALNNRKKNVMYQQDLIYMLKRVNRYYNYRYSKPINKVILKTSLYLAKNKILAKFNINRVRI